MSNLVFKVFLPLALAFIMFGMGLTLTLADFKRVISLPKATAIGLINQLILLPLFGLLVVTIFPLSPALTVGLLLLAFCPGGSTSNMISYLAKADVALSVTLTAISSLVTVITIPIFMGLAINKFMGNNASLNVLGIILPMFAIAIVPIVIGMFIKARSEVTAKAIEKILAPFSIGFFVFIIGAAIYSNRANFFTQLRQAAVPVLVLNVVMMAFGYFSAKVFKVNTRQSFTIALETGIQNGTLAITIAASILHNAEMATPGAVYGLLMFFTVIPVVLLARKTAAKAEV